VEDTGHVGHVGPAPQRRSALPDDVNPKHTFASFVVGPSNQLAHAAAVAAAGGGAGAIARSSFAAGTGLGKTHLIHAIAHRIAEERPSARILYVSAERFTNDFISSIQHHRMDEFRARFRSSCDVLLVDDIQSWPAASRRRRSSSTRSTRSTQTTGRSSSPAINTRRT
jgi:chromosomal replication initiator protein